MLLNPTPVGQPLKHSLIHPSNFFRTAPVQKYKFPGPVAFYARSVHPLNEDCRFPIIGDATLKVRDSSLKPIGGLITLLLGNFVDNAETEESLIHFRTDHATPVAHVFVFADVTIIKYLPSGNTTPVFYTHPPLFYDNHGSVEGMTFRKTDQLTTHLTDADADGLIGPQGGPRKQPVTRPAVSFEDMIKARLKSL